MRAIEKRTRDDSGRPSTGPDPPPWGHPTPWATHPPAGVARGDPRGRRGLFCMGYRKYTMGRGDARSHLREAQGPQPRHGRLQAHGLAAVHRARRGQTIEGAPLHGFYGHRSCGSTTSLHGGDRVSEVERERKSSQSAQPFRATHLNSQVLKYIAKYTKFHLKILNYIVSEADEDLFHGSPLFEFRVQFHTQNVRVSSWW